jgi:hypothetical protein
MLIYNTGSEPVVYAWGDGLVLPGESVDASDDTAVSFPWSTDSEAASKAASAFKETQGEESPADIAAPASGPQKAAQTAPRSTPETADTVGTATQDESTTTGGTA